MHFLEQRLGVKGRVAVIAGGAGGLGRACTLELGRAGMKIAVCDRNADLMAETEALLKGEGIEYKSAVFDVRDEERLKTFFDDVDKAFGDELHVFVNAVGGAFKQPFVDSVPKGWDAIIRINFTWLLHAIQLVIPRMSKGGSIINITTIESYRAAPDFAVYAGIKAAISNFGRTLAVEMAPKGIRVNEIAPDMTPTEGMAPIFERVEAAGEKAIELTYRVAIPAGRTGTYDDVGGCVLFLASDLSRYVTGQVLFPDGGTHASSGWFNWPEEGWVNTPPLKALQPYLKESDKG